MTVRWVLDTCVFSLNRAVHLGHTQGQRPLTIVISAALNPFHKPHAKCHFGHRASRLSWMHTPILKSRVCKGWLCKASSLRQRLGLYPCIAHFSTSRFSGSADLSHRMSRLRTTLESVSKAVSGTQSDLLAKIARRKPAQEGKDVRSSQEAPVEEKGSVASTAAASVPPASAALPPQPAVTVAAAVDHEVEEKRPKPPGDSTAQAKTNQRPPPRNADISSKSKVAPKPATPLFHPGTFAVNLDDTYNYVAHHINAYFGSATKGATDTEEKQLQLGDGISQPTTEEPDQNKDHTASPLSPSQTSLASPSTPP
ncbi:hypothetical protein AALO_G00159690, partial [Alosa alosa]